MTRFAFSLLFFACLLPAQYQGKQGDVHWIVARLGFPCDGQISEATRLCFEAPQGAFVHLRSEAIDFDGYRVMMYIREKGGATREVVKYVDREKHVFGGSQQPWATILFDNIGRVKTASLDGTEILYLHVNKVRRTDVSPIVVPLGNAVAGLPAIETFPPVRMSDGSPVIWRRW